MSRHSRWICCLCFGVALVTNSVQAQTHRLSPKEIGQIINAALPEVIPPERRLSSITAAERGIRFGYGRTLAAFGSADNASTRASLGLTRAMAEGSDALIEDCDQYGMSECSKLGKSVYVFLKPTSISNSEVVVWVYMSWVTTVSERSFRSGQGEEVILRRSGSGPWTFVRTGRGTIS